MTKETVGKVAYELLLKDPGNHTVEEQNRENLTDYEKNVIECVERSKKDIIGDFFVVVLTKKERLMQNVIRNYFFACQSCPTPTWDQILYKYSAKDDALKFVWVIPSKDACEYMKTNPLDIHPSERILLQYVLDFSDGTLLRLAKKFNGEKDDSPLLEQRMKYV